MINILPNTIHLEYVKKIISIASNQLVIEFSNALGIVKIKADNLELFNINYTKGYANFYCSKFHGIEVEE